MPKVSKNNRVSSSADTVNLNCGAGHTTSGTILEPRPLRLLFLFDFHGYVQAIHLSDAIDHYQAASVDKYKKGRKPSSP